MARAKSAKSTAAINRSRAAIIGTLCRAINLMQGVPAPYDPQQHAADESRLYELLQNTAFLLSQQGVPTEMMNRELHDAGWEDSDFHINESRAMLVEHR